LSSGRDHQAIEEAIERLLRAFDLEIYRKFPEVNGSWFRKFLVHAKQGAPDVEESVIKLVRALELQTLHRPQADIDAKQADAVAKLMNALDKEENAAIQIGSLLLVKVGRNYVVRNLSQLQLAHLESNPELFQNPATVLRQLQGLAVANAHPSMIAREPCPCGSNLPTESCHPGGCR
jgi:hypothetical protein